MSHQKKSDAEKGKFYPQKLEKWPTSMFSRFIDRIRSTFQRFQNKPQPDHELAGRIQDLQKTANSVVKQLHTIKDKLKNEIDQELFSHVQEIIDPIIKEVSRLNKSIGQPTSVVHQAKAYQRFSQWIEKAKLWIQFCSKTNDKEAILKAIIRYIVEDFLEVIDRDIQVINDYQNHMLDALAVEEEEKLTVLKNLNLEPYLQGLRSLQTKPNELSLHEIALWKAQVDKRREKYFDEALHTIDKVINSVIPDSSGEEEQEHLVDVLSQIVYLEREVPQLCDEIDRDMNPAPDKRIAFESRLSLFEQEVHQLNLDLRITPDLIERLQIIIEMINQGQKKLI